MDNETSREKQVRHLKSAGLTFLTALGVELYDGMQAATTWSDVSWSVLLSAGTFTAARAVLKVTLTEKVVQAK